VDPKEIQIARKGGREVDGELAELDPSNDKSGGQDFEGDFEVLSQVSFLHVWRQCWADKP